MRVAPHDFPPGLNVRNDWGFATQKQYTPNRRKNKMTKLSFTAACSIQAETGSLEKGTILMQPAYAAGL